MPEKSGKAKAAPKKAPDNKKMPKNQPSPGKDKPPQKKTPPEKSGGAAAFVQSASARIAPERLARMIERLPDSRGGAYLRDELAWMIL